MLIYIFKSAACMAIFFVFYKFLLERENMHVFKRFYLLLAIGAALVIPALVFTEYVVVEPMEYTAIQPSDISNYDNIRIPVALEKDVLDIEPVLWTAYFFGFAFFGLRFIRNLFQIVQRVRKNPKQKSASFIQVLLKENFPPHTFFKYIFLNKKKLESNEIPKEVLLHEETHAKQKHSWDVICIELLQVIFWFNPMVYLFKKSIKLNHEFLADQAVLDKDVDKTTYQNTLLSYLSPDSQNKYQSKMANAINYSSIKKRFTIMKTHTSKKAVLLRTLLLLPLLAVLILGFSETKLIEVTNSESGEIKKEATKEQLAKYNKMAKSHNIFSDHNIRPRESEIRILTRIYNLMTEEQKNKAEVFPEYPFKDKPQEGASIKLVSEYNKLAKHYNDMSRNKMKIYEKDVNRLEYLYGLMSDKQKANAEPFPDFPEPPPAPKAPKEPKVKKAPKALKEVKAPKVKKGEKSNIPPPSAPNLSDEEFAEKVVEEVIANQDPYDHGSEIKFSSIDKIIPQPPAPPEPQSPLDHVIEMAKKDATFYYEGEEISANKAIDLMKKNKSINIDSRGANGKKPVVKMSKQAISIEN